LSSSAGDSTHIKGWLMTAFKWNPSQYKERDLTCDAKKKKVTQEKFEAAVEKYVEQTLSSPFCQDRCYELETTPKKLREKLLKHDMKRPLKVYTNPTLTVGQEKEIDPNLLAIALISFLMLSLCQITSPTLTVGTAFLAVVWTLTTTRKRPK